MQVIANTADDDSADASHERSAAVQVAGHAEIVDLIRTQYSGLISLAQRKLKDRELAADLINEAIVVTLDHIRIGRPIEPRHVAGYVFKVGLNLLRNRQRNAHNRADLRADAKTLETLSECDDDVVQATQIRQKALQVINSLGSPRDREVVKRFYLDEDEKVVICADLGLTPLQFTQVMSRARQRMKLLFESQGIKSTDFYSFIVVLGVALLHSSLFA